MRKCLPPRCNRVSLSLASWQVVTGRMPARTPVKRMFRLLTTVAACLLCAACASDPMIAASARGDVEMARIKLAAEPDLSVDNRRQYMQTGAFCGHREYVQFWIENGCSDQNSLDHALFWAAHTGRAQTVRELIVAGADPDFDKGTFATLTPVAAVLLRAAGNWTNSEPDTPSAGEPRNVLGTLMVLHRAGADMRFDWTDAALFLDRARRRGHGVAVDYFLLASRLQNGKSRAERQATASQHVEEIAGELASGIEQLEEKVKALGILSAARAGDPVAMRALGKLYASGDAGLPQSEQAAVEWWRKAAQLNDEESQAELRSRGIEW
jgi:hypothetical protein